MKIGILTLPFNNNYGGYLQAYALMTVLKSMGHQVEIIYRRNNRRSKWCRLKIIVKSFFKTILGRKVISFLPNQEREHRYRGKLLMSFVDRYLSPVSKPLYSSSAMYEYIRKSEYDMIVVGSDQVWRPDYGQKFVQDFFLTKLKTKSPKLISYAASFGTASPCYTEKEKEECGKALINFKSVSVREESGLEIISNFCWQTNNKPIVVLDPTFLLPSSHYLSLLPQYPSKSKGKIFCYILDNNKDISDIIGLVSKHTGLDIFHILDTNWKAPLYVMPSMEDWLSGIYYAEFVITDSFHGMVFSIIFKKPFIVKSNLSRGADRFITFLSQLGLESRLINNDESLLFVVNQKINWKEVYNRLDIEIEKSKTYLKKSLCL